jgi:hypothetical protein
LDLLLLFIYFVLSNRYTHHRKWLHQKSYSTRMRFIHVRVLNRAYHLHGQSVIPTCAALVHLCRFFSTNISCPFMNPRDNLGFLFFFSPGTGNSYKMRRSLICDANVFSMRRESGDREKSRWYIAILQHFSVVFQLEKKIVCGEEEVVCVKPCKADWGRIIENPSLRPFPGFKRPVCLFFFNQICGLEFWFDLRGEFWYRQGLDRDWIIGTGFCSYFVTSLLRIKRMKWKPRNSQLDEPNWNQHRCVHGVPTHNSESVGKILESVYVEKRGK